MVVSVGSHINEYTVIETLYNHDHLDIFEVVDIQQKRHVLKMYKKEISPRADQIEEASINRFLWHGIRCAVHNDECIAKKDYFNLKGSDESSRAGPVRRQIGGIVRTPMPCEQSREEEDEEEEDEDDDEDEEDEDEEDDEDEDEDEDAQDSEEGEESEDDEELSPVVHIVTPGDSDRPRPILLHGNGTHQRESSRVNIQSPVQKAFHLRHRDLPRTPMPGVLRTDDPSETQRSIDQEKCRFQLKMISSSMLKRRSAKSMAM